MFNLITLLPHVMTIGDDIIKCIDGGVTQNEWDKTVDDFYKLAVSIPQIQGILGIIEIISMVTKISFPLVDGFLNQEDDTSKPKMMAAKRKLEQVLSTEDKEKAERSVKFFAAVNEKIAEHNGLKLYNNYPDDDTNWTETFFERQ